MKHWIFAFIVIFVPRAWTADGGSVPVIINNLSPATSQAPTPELVKAGDRYNLDFKDGRVATLLQAIGQIQRGNVTLKQTENTCDPKQIPSVCKLQIDIATYAVYLKWTKHPDPKKIGQILKMTQQGANPPTADIEDNQQTMLWYTSIKQPEWASFFKPDVLVCDNLNWASQIPRNGNRLTVQSWTSEVMTVNQEDQVNENETFAGVFNAELVQVDNNSLRFDKFGADSSQFSTLPPYMGFQTSTVNFQAADHDECQVSFQVDLQSLVQDIAKPDSKILSPNTERPLTWGPALNNTEVQNKIQQILQPLQSGTTRTWSVE